MRLYNDKLSQSTTNFILKFDVMSWYFFLLTHRFAATDGAESCVGYHIQIKKWSTWHTGLHGTIGQRCRTMHSSQFQIEARDNTIRRGTACPCCVFRQHALEDCKSRVEILTLCYSCLLLYTRSVLFPLVLPEGLISLCIICVPVAKHVVILRPDHLLKRRPTAPARIRSRAVCWPKSVDLVRLIGPVLNCKLVVQKYRAAQCHKSEGHDDFVFFPSIIIFLTLFFSRIIFILIFFFVLVRQIINDIYFFSIPLKAAPSFI